MDYMDWLLHKVTWGEVMNLPYEGQYNPYRFIKDESIFKTLEERFGLTDTTQLSLEVFNGIRQQNSDLSDWILYAVACYHTTLSGEERFDLVSNIRGFTFLHKAYDEIPGLSPYQDEALDELRVQAREKEALEKYKK